MINRHGQKAPGSEQGFSARAAAEQLADQLNAVGYDDAPFTVAHWGESAGFYGAEGHEEARAERGETT